MKNKIFYLMTAMLIQTRLLAQDFGLEDSAQDFWDQLKSSAVYIIAAIFLISVIFNIGKVTGENRDYKSFFAGVFLYAFAIVLIGGIITWILGLNFG